MDNRELNEVVKSIEIAYRNDKNRWKTRLGAIDSVAMREIMLKHKIGLQCEKCLRKPYMGRYCCGDHSIYFNRLFRALFWPVYPFSKDELDELPGHLTDAYDHKHDIECPECKTKAHWSSMSIDHIVSIASGGLEFDRNNLQWMCLSCNCAKSGGERGEKIAKRKIYESKQTKLEGFA